MTTGTPVDIADLKTGERVRATLGESVVVGKVLQVYRSRHGHGVAWIAPDGLYYGHKIKAPYIVTREGDGS